MYFKGKSAAKKERFCFGTNFKQYKVYRYRFLKLFLNHFMPGYKISFDLEAVYTTV